MSKRSCQDEQQRRVRTNTVEQHHQQERPTRTKPKTQAANRWGVQRPTPKNSTHTTCKHPAHAGLRQHQQQAYDQLQWQARLAAARLPVTTTITYQSLPVKRGGGLRMSAIYPHSTILSSGAPAMPSRLLLYIHASNTRQCAVRPTRCRRRISRAHPTMNSSRSVPVGKEAIKCVKNRGTCAVHQQPCPHLQPPHPHQLTFTDRSESSSSPIKDLGQPWPAALVTRTKNTKQSHLCCPTLNTKTSLATTK
jgi:hypothetical protein